MMNYEKEQCFNVRLLFRNSYLSLPFAAEHHVARAKKNF